MTVNMTTRTSVNGWQVWTFSGGSGAVPGDGLDGGGFFSRMARRVELRHLSL